MPDVRERLSGGPGPVERFANLIPSPVATQALAPAGADVVLIDQEHGPIGLEGMHAMVASTAGTACSPWVRVPGCHEASVKAALDAGAEGIVFPLVTTAKSAADCVALTRYPPEGRRGWGPFVAHSRWGVGLFDYLSQRGGETVCTLYRLPRWAFRLAAQYVATFAVDTSMRRPRPRPSVDLTAAASWLTLGDH